MKAEGMTPSYLRIHTPSMPWPDANMERYIITLGRGNTLYEVGDNDPMPYRKAVETIGKYFQREFRFDFRPYRTSWHDPTNVVFVWIGEDFDWSGNKKAVVFGACEFDTDKASSNGDDRYLAWIWLHPYYRQRGLLAGAWPYFKGRFGDFGIERPLSSGMRAFLRSMQKREDKGNTIIDGEEIG